MDYIELEIREIEGNVIRGEGENVHDKCGKRERVVSEKSMTGKLGFLLFFFLFEFFSLIL